MNNSIIINTPSVVACNGHLLVASNHTASANYLHFAKLYTDANNELLQPVNFANKAIGYKYLEQPSSTSTRYLLPCAENGAIRFAKVLVHSSKSHFSLPTNEEISVINSHPAAEHVLNAVYSVAANISQQIKDNHRKTVQNSPAIVKNAAIESEIPAYDVSPEYEPFNFNIDSTLHGPLYLVPIDDTDGVVFEPTYINNSVSTGTRKRVPPPPPPPPPSRGFKKATGMTDRNGRTLSQPTQKTTAKIMDRKTQDLLPNKRPTPTSTSTTRPQTTTTSTTRPQTTTTTTSTTRPQTSTTTTRPQTSTTTTRPQT